MNCHIFAFQNLNGHPNFKKNPQFSYEHQTNLFEVTERDSLCVHQINEALVLFIISLLRGVRDEPSWPLLMGVCCQRDRDVGEAWEAASSATESPGPFVLKLADAVVFFSYQTLG